MGKRVRYIWFLAQISICYPEHKVLGKQHRSTISQIDLARRCLVFPPRRTYFLHLLTVVSSCNVKILPEPERCVLSGKHPLLLFEFESRVFSRAWSSLPRRLPLSFSPRKIFLAPILRVAGTVCQRHDWNPNWFAADFPPKWTHASRAETKSCATRRLPKLSPSQNAKLQAHDTLQYLRCGC
jgi:hypothetical protein